jgi:FkbM family methyltransferase
MVYVGDHVPLTRTVYGHKMFVDSRTQIGANFLLDGYWEEWITRHLKDLVKPGMRVLDIGANMGFYTLLLADLVGPDGHVTAFEAHPNLFDLLARNVEVNGYLDRTTLVRKLVHERPGVFPLLSHERYGTGAVCSPARDPNHEPAATRSGERPVLRHLEGISLDDYLGSESPAVDLIKIDTDGAEPYIFRGMKGLLGSGRPLTILTEFSAQRYTGDGLDPVQFLQEIRAAGFQISEFTPTGIEPVTALPQLATVPWAELLLIRTAAARPD